MTWTLLIIFLFAIYYLTDTRITVLSKHLTITAILFMQVISTGYTRAVFTAQSIMLGLFPNVPLGFFDDADPEDKVLLRF
jgi:hypothetical protein